MLNVKQFRYGDNFSYLIYGERRALAIDGGAWPEILNYLQGRFLTLEIVTNTHCHADHTLGNDNLLKSTKSKYLSLAGITDDQEISIDGQRIIVYRTPGHSVDSVCFYTGESLVSGDTLFNGTIGNCFTGDWKSFYLSIKRLMTLPDETVIYAGHDYIRDSLAFARCLEPENKDIDIYESRYDPDHVYSTMGDERRVNPYLRFNEAPIIRLLQKKGLPHATEWERWQSLVSIE